MARLRHLKRRFRRKTRSRMAVRSSISRSAVTARRDGKGADNSFPGKSSSTKGPLADARGSLKPFLLHLASERGLAVNSLLAYRRDLEDTENWLAERGRTFLNASVDEFRAYL